jgi:acetaldehyde dehydrogenase (acetylating)
MEKRALLKAAEDAGFDVIVTGDLSLEYQQNISVRKIAVVSLSAHNWRIVKNHVAKIVAAVASAQPGTLTRVDCGTFVRRTKKPKGPLPG